MNTNKIWKLAIAAGVAFGGASFTHAAEGIAGQTVKTSSAPSTMNSAGINEQKTALFGLFAPNCRNSCGYGSCSYGNCGYGGCSPLGGGYYGRPAPRPYGGGYFGTPVAPVPAYGAPIYGTPAYSVPGYSTPMYGVPGYGVPYYGGFGSTANPAASPIARSSPVPQSGYRSTSASPVPRDSTSPFFP